MSTESRRKRRKRFSPDSDAGIEGVCRAHHNFIKTGTMYLTYGASSRYYIFHGMITFFVYTINPYRHIFSGRRRGEE